MTTPEPQTWLSFLQQLNPTTQQQVAACLQQPIEAGAPPPQWYLVVVPDTGQPQVLSFETAAAVRERLMSLAGTDAACFVFFGFRAQISKKPFRYLLLPNGQQLPLFELPRVDEVDEQGYMGDPVGVTGTIPPSAEEARDEYEEVEVDDDEDAD